VCFGLLPAAASRKRVRLGGSQTEATYLFSEYTALGDTDTNGKWHYQLEEQARWPDCNVEATQR